MIAHAELPAVRFTDWHVNALLPYSDPSRARLNHDTAINIVMNMNLGTREYSVMLQLTFYRMLQTLLLFTCLLYLFRNLT